MRRECVGRHVEGQLVRLVHFREAVRDPLRRQLWPLIDAIQTRVGVQVMGCAIAPKNSNKSHAHHG